MANFDKYAPRLLKWEGGYVDNPSDPGGATCKGVTLETFRKYAGEDKTKDDLRGISKSDWKIIMKDMYWDRCGADFIRNQSIAEIFVDWCVNSGTGMIKKVQALVGAKADGIVGPKTLSAINKADQEKLHEEIWKAREAYFNAIVKKRPSSRIFLKGWMNRLDDFVYSK